MLVQYLPEGRPHRYHVRFRCSGQDGSVIRAVDELMDIFLHSERTIILAVVPANQVPPSTSTCAGTSASGFPRPPSPIYSLLQDLATVDILERAAEVDPKGDRTIGVLTKPDLVAPGSEEAVFETVSNRLKPLKLGYVIMKNRTQTEVAEGISLGEARVNEKRYFEGHDVFSRLQPHLVGGEALTTRLADLLVKRIKSVLPVMKVTSSACCGKAGVPQRASHSLACDHSSSSWRCSGRRTVR